MPMGVTDSVLGIRAHKTVSVTELARVGREDGRERRTGAVYLRVLWQAVQVFQIWPAGRWLSGPLGSEPGMLATRSGAAAEARKAELPLLSVWAGHVGPAAPSAAVVRPMCSGVAGRETTGEAGGGACQRGHLRRLRRDFHPAAVRRQALFGSMSASSVPQAVARVSIPDRSARCGRRYR